MDGSGRHGTMIHSILVNTSIMFVKKQRKNYRLILNMELAKISFLPLLETIYLAHTCCLYLQFSSANFFVTLLF